MLVGGIIERKGLVAAAAGLAKAAMLARPVPAKSWVSHACAFCCTAAALWLCCGVCWRDTAAGVDVLGVGGGCWRGAAGVSLGGAGSSRRSLATSASFLSASID